MFAKRSQEMSTFVDQVQQRAGLDNTEEADQLSRASVQVLGQAISGGQAEQLARWLPDELSTELAAQSGQASGFDKPQLLEKVGGKILTVDSDEIERQVAAVLSTLRASAPEGELDDTLAQLPPELETLFATGERG